MYVPLVPSRSSCIDPWMRRITHITKERETTIRYINNWRKSSPFILLCSFLSPSARVLQQLYTCILLRAHEDPSRFWTSIAATKRKYKKFLVCLLDELFTTVWLDLPRSLGFILPPDWNSLSAQFPFFSTVLLYQFLLSVDSSLVYYVYSYRRNPKETCLFFWVPSTAFGATTLFSRQSYNPCQIMYTFIVKERRRIVHNFLHSNFVPCSSNIMHVIYAAHSLRSVHPQLLPHIIAVRSRFAAGCAQE